MKERLLNRWQQLLRFNSYCGIIASPIVTEAVGPQTEYQMPGCCRRESRFVSLTVTTTLMAADREAGSFHAECYDASPGPVDWIELPDMAFTIMQIQFTDFFNSRNTGFHLLLFLRMFVGFLKVLVK